jgi:signal-transduction protein with cAMP-binding, CBS, and nucleotidyltransferase domain
MICFLSFVFSLSINPDCVGAIVARLRTQIYMQGDVIFHKGSIGKELYFISKGSVEVLNDDGTVFWYVFYLFRCLAWIC